MVDINQPFHLTVFCFCSAGVIKNPSQNILALRENLPLLWCRARICQAMGYYVQFSINKKLCKSFVCQLRKPANKGSSKKQFLVCFMQTYTHTHNLTFNHKFKQKNLNLDLCCIPQIHPFANRIQPLYEQLLSRPSTLHVKWTPIHLII